MSVLVTLTAVPVSVVIVLPVPLTVSVPLSVALMPAPLVVSMSRPPPESVERVAVARRRMTTACSAPVLRTFEALLNVVEPPVLPATADAAARRRWCRRSAPLSVTAPPLRPVISAVWPAPLLSAPG